MARERGTIQLKRDGKTGVWYLHWSENGRSKRRSTGERDSAKAEACRAHFVLEGRQTNGDIAVCAALEDYWKEHAQKVESADRIHIIIRHLNECLGAWMVSTLDRVAVNHYVTHRRGLGIGDGTIRRELGTLIAAINHAARERHMDRNLVPHIALPSEPPPKERWLTDGEAEALRKACGEDLMMRVFIELAIQTAARKRAIETLTWFGVDLDRGVIDYNPPGRRQTAKRRARVPISDTLLPWLRQAKERWPSSEFVLGGQYRVADRFETVVRRAGLWSEDRLARVTPHTLRHTWATWAAQRGVDMGRIAAVLGDTVQTVHRKYVHWSPEYLRSAVNFGVSQEVGHVSRDG